MALATPRERKGEETVTAAKGLLDGVLRRAAIPRDQVGRAQGAVGVKMAQRVQSGLVAALKLHHGVAFVRAHPLLSTTLVESSR